MKKLITLLATAALVTSLSSVFAQDEPTVDVQALSIETGTISDYLKANAQSADAAPDVACYTSAVDMGQEFTCLVQALNATGLSETLAGEGEFTVFAPTDAAFSDLAGSMAQSEWDALFTDPDALRPILSYHVLPKTLTLNNLFVAAEGAMGNVTEATVEGSDLQIHFANAAESAMTTTVTLGADAAMAGAPHVVGRTVQLDNGVVIPIDQVLSVPAN